MPSGYEDAREITAAERRSFIMSLRKRAVTWQEIADQTIAKFGAENLPSGFDRLYAYKDFKRYMGQLYKRTDQDAVAALGLELERMDDMLRAIWDAVENGDLQAIDRALRIGGRRDTLLGLAAPSRMRLVDREDGDVTPVGVVVYLPQNGREGGVG